MDYLYPTATEIPVFDIGHLETPSPVVDGGVEGLGEGGTIATPAAVVNAVADALQPRVDRSDAARSQSRARSGPGRNRAQLIPTRAR
ncbi:MAG: hypothetical protein R2736_09625 [Solirubrobacterales bacterium]